MVKVKLTIGDWSNDGHGNSEIYVYESNKTVKEIQKAYMDSCNKTGLSFHHSSPVPQPHIGLNWDELKAKQLFCEYEDNEMSNEQAKTLAEFGVICDGDADDDMDGFYMDPDGLAGIIIDFIKISLPDWEPKEASFKKSELQSIKPINGWWCEGLNVGFGYGVCGR